MKEKLRPHKYVKYTEDCSSQYDDDDDSDYYPSSQDSQVSLLEIGIRRIESVYKEERRKEKNETSSGVNNKQEPEVEERRKEELEVPSTMINKQKPEVEQRTKEKNETSYGVINKQEPKIEERRKEKIETSTMINKQTPIVVPELMEEVMKSDNNSEKLEGGIFWKEFQRKMLRCKNFAEIVQIVDSMKIPDISLQRKTTMQPHDREDRISQFLLPQDVDKNLVPVMCKGDGNCFARAISHFCFGTECRHREIHCRMVIDAVKNISNHLNNEKLYTGAINRLPNLDIRNFYAYIVPAYDIVQPDEINEDSLLQIYQEEVKRIIQPKKWMSMWHIHWASNAVRIPIRVVYPMFNLWDRNYFNRFVYPLDKKNYSSDLTIMWTSTNDVDLNIDHFVPLMLRK